MVSVNRQSTVVAKLLPRVRGIRGIPSMPSRIPGTTSAYAENTWWEVSMPSMVWNYLRVRGEYAEAREKKIGMLELPPRTRRILQLDNIPTVPLGTTSAYAENTGLSNNLYSTPLELPPRTRRILAHELGVTILMGTTSAYAENTIR